MSHDAPFKRCCPCCDNRTLDEHADYEICPVCFWEDDGQDDESANEIWGGANGDISLTAARQNYIRIGAADPKNLRHVRAPTEAEAAR
ncbi:hypothetical protein GRI97_07790 [Altererythrobacter xixiisoli]|uniref:Cysteine-rich CPCC domain-containing protein n=1 Tax=Croceibacterium xixiisoli TaxID=1476466 RepID=A0A6I4TSG4_9SPHN|nr:CPCC family cysteine-rich protein [Croceibacterium xixiisoli]MXO98886.1 hypothetical protein [Croceibacterium xixiisoli]